MPSEPESVVAPPAAGRPAAAAAATAAAATAIFDFQEPGLLLCSKV